MAKIRETVKFNLAKINEEENEDFFEQEYFSFESPNLGENHKF